jgi:hypothetical protein
LEKSLPDRQNHRFTRIVKAKKAGMKNKDTGFGTRDPNGAFAAATEESPSGK